MWQTNKKTGGVPSTNPKQWNKKATDIDLSCWDRSIRSNIVFWQSEHLTITPWNVSLVFEVTAIYFLPLQVDALRITNIIFVFSPTSRQLTVFFIQHNPCFILVFLNFFKNKFLNSVVFFFSLVDRFSLEAFASAAFNYKGNILDDPNATLFRYMRAFNHSSSADNPIAGLASKSFLLMMENNKD